MYGFNPGHPGQQAKLLSEVSLNETKSFLGRQYIKSIIGKKILTVHSLVSPFLGLGQAQCFLLLTQCLSIIWSP